MGNIFSAFLYVLLWGTLCSPFSLLAQKSKTTTKTLTQKDSLRLNDIFINATQAYINEDYADYKEAFFVLDENARIEIHELDA